jgi:hypothetical protein
MGGPKDRWVSLGPNFGELVALASTLALVGGQFQWLPGMRRWESTPEKGSFNDICFIS